MNIIGRVRVIFQLLGGGQGDIDNEITILRKREVCR